MAVFIGQLPAGGINIFTPTSAQPGIYLMFFKKGYKRLYFFFGWFGKISKIYGVIFNNINKISRHLAVNFYQFFCIFQAIIKLIKENIFKCDLIFCLLIKII